MLKCLWLAHVTEQIFLDAEKELLDATKPATQSPVRSLFGAPPSRYIRTKACEAAARTHLTLDLTKNIKMDLRVPYMRIMHFHRYKYAKDLQFLSKPGAKIYVTHIEYHM